MAREWKGTPQQRSSEKNMTIQRTVFTQLFIPEDPITSQITQMLERDCTPFRVHDLVFVVQTSGLSTDSHGLHNTTVNCGCGLALDLQSQATGTERGRWAVCDSGAMRMAY